MNKSQKTANKYIQILPASVDTPIASLGDAAKKKTLDFLSGTLSKTLL
jgi:hypothetical protein